VIARAVREWNEAEHAAGVGAEHRSFHLPADGTTGAATRRALLVHGAGGSPADFRELGAFLHSRGWTVACPLLPGHGRRPEDLGEVRFRDLLATVTRAHELLRDGGRPVGVVAQSLGAVLAVHLAVGSPLRALVALAPALRPFVLRRIWLLGLLVLVRPRLAAATWRWQRELLRGIRETRELLDGVRCPLLVLHSRDDRSVSPRGGEELWRGAGSPEKRHTVLDGQGHVLSLAPARRELVFAPALSFLESAADGAVAATAGEAGSRTTGPPRAAG
jgi:carboxylesterase